MMINRDNSNVVSKSAYRLSYSETFVGYLIGDNNSYYIGNRVLFNAKYFENYRFN